MKVSGASAGRPNERSVSCRPNSTASSKAAACIARHGIERIVAVPGVDVCQIAPFDLEALRSGRGPLQFKVRGRDDVGIV